MSEHKFTPGPWEMVGDDRWSSSGFRIVDGQDNEVEIAATGAWGPEYSAEEEANARLMTAAPDLLEALEEVMDCWLYGAAQPDKQKAISLAQQAIAKALGNQ